MRVLYFGTYETAEGYPRNRVLIEGLRRAGVEVVEVHEELWADPADKLAAATKGIVRTALRTLVAWRRLATAYLRAPDHDVVVVGYTGQVDVLLARMLSRLRRRPVVLDAFLSLHDTLVTDRRMVGEGSIAASLLRALDTTACRAADLVLLDTAAHADWFRTYTRLPADRFARLFVGSGFPPAPPREPDGTFRVLWFGSWVPLQGVATVLDAAERLGGEGVSVRMVGKGQQLDVFRRRAEASDAVDLVPRWLSSAELRDEMAAADVCLGIFGTTPKALRVIPCKVYDALAAGRPVVTADTPGAAELLEDGRDALLVPPGNGDALATAILGLRDDADLRNSIAAGGAETSRTRAAPEVLGQELRALLETLQTARS